MPVAERHVAQVDAPWKSQWLLMACVTRQQDLRTPPWTWKKLIRPVLVGPERRMAHQRPNAIVRHPRQNPVS